MNTLPKQIETACTRGPRHAGSIDETVVKYIGFQPHSREKCHGYYGKAVYNHWTGLVDWTGGLDWWTGLVDWTGGLTLKIICFLTRLTCLWS